MRALYCIAKREIESFGSLTQSTINQFRAIGIDPSRIEESIRNG
jgi:hypothetical protein